MWTREFDTDFRDGVSGSFADSTGVYVAGWTDGALPGQESAGGDDAFVRKYDIDGVELWTRQFGTQFSDRALAVAAGSSGLYLAGQTEGRFPGQASKGGFSNAFIAKFVSTPSADLSVTQTISTVPPLVRREAGDIHWIRQFGPAAKDRIFGVAADPTGLYMVGGDTFIRKYDFDGTELWNRQSGLARPISVDSTGVYVAGGTRRGFDAFVRKFDADGNELWTHKFGTLGNDIAYGIAVSSAGVYVVGWTGFNESRRRWFCPQIHCQWHVAVGSRVCVGI